MVSLVAALVLVGSLSSENPVPAAGEGVMTAGPSLGARMTVESAHVQGPVGGLAVRGVWGFAPGFEVGADLQGSAGFSELVTGRSVPALADVGALVRWKLRDTGRLAVLVNGRASVTAASAWPTFGGTASVGVQAVVAPTDTLTVTVGASATVLMDAALIRYEGAFPMAVGAFQGGQPTFVPGGGPEASLTWELAPRVGLTASARALLMAPYGTLRPYISASIGPSFAL